MIETERLILRRFVPADLPTLIAQRTDPEVARYIGGLELQQPVFIEKRLNDYFGNYEALGFGMCAMIWKETGENIGWSGLQPLEDSGEIEVGYGMIPEFWGLGIGFECARAWLDYGFNTLGLGQIVAIAYEENTPSRRIMEKCGMTYTGIGRFHGMDLVQYAISREDFLNLNGNAA
jgi:ribosomal-protein-alanine N-acetyltransferase